MEITNVEQAREFYVKKVHDCPRPSVDIDDDSMNAYEQHSSRALERIWAFEEFVRYFSLIKPKNHDNLKLLKEAWKWHENSTPVKLVAEKLEIMMSDCGGKPDKSLIGCLHITAKYSEIDKLDRCDELTLFRLMELVKPYLSEEENEALRFKVAGPDTEDEAKRFYKTIHFSDRSDFFQTNTAEKNFKQFATPENMIKWTQEYFDEWTGKEYFLNKDALVWVNLIELAVLNYGIYSRKNTGKLYNKLADYKHCADIDQYWNIVSYIELDVFKKLYNEGEYDQLERFINLAESIYKAAPDSWEKNYFVKDLPEKAEKYRALLKQAGWKNDGIRIYP